jgi:prepilin-type N-terminal cleavage/methylation domain-containing protein
MKARRSGRRGFTLVEMLVAMAILSFMMVMMARFTSMAEQIWRLEQDRIDNFTKARSMLDLITDDLQRAVIRGDLPIFETGAPAATPTLTGSGLYYFPATSSTSAGASVFATAFYTMLPGASGTSTPVRDVSLVSYVLSLSATTQDKIILQRSDLSVPWTSGSNICFQSNMAPLLQSGVQSAQIEVAPGVVGFCLAFRRADGTLVDPAQSGPNQYTGYNATNPVVAVDVGLAVIGKGTLELLSTSQIQDIQSRLATGIVANENNGILRAGIKTTWDQQVLNTAFFSAYPRDLGQGLRTFERCVACTPF